MCFLLCVRLYISLYKMLSFWPVIGYVHGMRWL